MKGNKLSAGAYIDKICVEGMQKTLDTWLEIVKHAPGSTVTYEFYPLASVLAKVPVESTAFSQRKKVRGRVRLERLWLIQVCRIG